MGTAQGSYSAPDSGFARWRATRPFWGAVLLILASLLIAWVPMQFAIELLFIGGAFTVVGLVFAVIVFLLGVFALLRPDLSTILGITGIAFSVLSLIGALGGLLFGAVLGIAGGALCVAWTPPEGIEREPERSSIGSTTRDREESSVGTSTTGDRMEYSWEGDDGTETAEPPDTGMSTTLSQEEPDHGRADTSGDQPRFEWGGSESETTGRDATTTEETTTEPAETWDEESASDLEGDADDTPTFSWQEDPYAEGKDDGGRK